MRFGDFMTPGQEAAAASRLIMPRKTSGRVKEPNFITRSPLSQPEIKPANDFAVYVIP
jgi:hypothetical protein